LSPRNRKILVFIFKAGISAAALAYTWYLLKEDSGDDAGPGGSRISVLFDIPASGIPAIVISFLLLGANLGIEAWKWRLLLGRLYPGLTWRSAVGAIFAGMTTGMFTPNRIGEYAGRVIFLPQGKKLEAILLTFLDRISQMFVTLIFGILVLLLASVSGCAEENAFTNSVEMRVAAAAGLCLILVVTAIFALNPKLTGMLLGRIPISWKWLRRISDTLCETDSILMRKVLGLSSLRYAVFISQYVFLVYAFGGTAGILQVYSACMIVMLVKSLIPFIGFSEIGIRESTAIHVMAWIGIGSLAAFQSTILLYLINILLPSAVGIYFVMKGKVNMKPE